MKKPVIVDTVCGDSSNHIKIATENRAVKTIISANFPRFFFTNISPKIVKNNNVAINTITAGAMEVALLHRVCSCVSVKSFTAQVTTSILSEYTSKPFPDCFKPITYHSKQTYSLLLFWCYDISSYCWFCN